MVLLLIAVFSALLTLKYFPGLENETSYAGFSFQAIYPDALRGDPYFGPEKGLFEVPMRLSGYYLLPKIFGEIWLDDRFVSIFYWALVAASFVAIDRITVLLGATSLGERLIVLMMFLKDHQILDNKVLLSHDPDINHAFLSISITFWLVYAVMARKGMWLVFALSLLLIVMSVRNAPFAVAAAFLVYAMMGTKRDRNIVALLFAGGVVVTYFVIGHVLLVAENERLAIWEIMVTDVEANGIPFYMGFSGQRQVSVLFDNLIFFAICATALVGPWRYNIPMFCLRSIVAMGIVLWLVGGLWINFGPDFMKIPQLLGFPVVRLLEVPQNLAYIAITVTVLQWAKASHGVRPIIASALVIAVLFVLGPGNQWQWAALLTASAITVFVVLWLYRSGSGSASDEWVARAREKAAILLRRDTVPFFGCSLALCLAVSLSMSIYKISPAWRTLMETGVFGNASSAPWIGVAEYVREHVPSGKTVLPLHYAEPSVGGRLKATRSLATRSGHGITVPHEYTDPFHLAGWAREREHFCFISEVKKSLFKGNGKRAWAAISQLSPIPDYLVVPDTIAGGVIGPRFPYVKVGTVRGHTLMHRRGLPPGNIIFSCKQGKPTP